MLCSVKHRIVDFDPIKTERTDWKIIDHLK